MAATNDDRDELRGQTPRTILGVLDAVSAVRRMSRIQLVNEVLAEWAERAQAEAIAIERVLRRPDQVR
jgi:hypothetical protein